MCMHDSTVTTEIEKKKAKDAINEKRKSRQWAKQCVNEIADALPDGFDEWHDKQFDKYMFFKRLAKNCYFGYCECGAKSVLTVAKNNTYTTCPVCGKWVHLITFCEKRYKGRVKPIKQVDERNRVAVVLPSNKGFIQRLFVSYKFASFDGEQVRTTSIMREEERDYLGVEDDRWWAFHPANEDSNREWRLGQGKTHAGGWLAWNAGSEPLKTFPNNLTDIFKESKYKYSAIEIATAKSFLNPFGYLYYYRKHPKIELIFKMGLYALAKDMYSGYYSTEVSRKLEKMKSPLKELGIDSKNELAECAALSFDDLIARKETKHWGYSGYRAELAIQFIKFINYNSGEDFVYNFISREKLFKYYLSQRDKFSGLKVGEPASFAKDYIDYISMCSRLGFNLKDTAIYKPKDFKAMHDNVMLEEKLGETKVYDELIYSAYNTLHKLTEWSNGKLKILMPKTSKDLLLEGKRQSHCVGRYCERVAKGESVILFIRRCEDAKNSFYTLEIKRDMHRLNVVQCRGYSNCEMTKEVSSFIAQYESWFNSRTVGAYNDDSIMVKYYKAVHKIGGKYISNFDKKTEFRIGEWSSAKIDSNPDAVAVKGLHIASLEFAQSFGDLWKDVAILEVETSIHDVVVPDAKDQVRTSKFKVLREVPFSEQGAWGQKHMTETDERKVAA